MLLDLQFLTWVRQESAKLAELWPMGSPLERDLLASWANNRPQMMAQLEEHKVAPQLAHVLIDRMIQAEREYLRSGMGPTDATEQAERDWLMLEPESENQPLDQTEPTTTSATPNS
jgi:hypothetical protein